MCGISGVHSTKKSAEKLTSIAINMSKAIIHRGPDDNGVWIDKNYNLALSHRRLSIIDTSNGGHQPMSSQCSRYTIVFNGEIYNYQSLRKKIENFKSNIKWQGGSDTEVLLEALSAWGLSSTLKKVEGMFAFALWDSVDGKLFLARDRFGEKPLYYGYIGKDFVFASELKALRAHPDFKSSIDRDSISLFLQYSHIPSPKSIFKNIYKLPPASFLTLDLRNNQQEILNYWSLELNQDINYKNNASNKEVILSQLHEKLNSSVIDQMVADVPVGAFLSGGIDSSLIVALMQQNSMKPIHSFSIGFTESEYDESKYARAVANHLGTKHTELIVSPADLLNVLPMLPNIYDEPFADSSQTPTYLVSKLARTDVTVALTGDGGDEVFGGYNRHMWANNVWNKMNHLPNWIRVSLSAILSSPSEYRINKIFVFLNHLIPYKYHINLPGQKIHKVATSLSALNINDLYLCLTSLWSNLSNVVINSDQKEIAMNKIKGDSCAEQMMYLDLGIYLPGDILTKVDRAAMGVSLETRVPILNHKVVEFAWSMPIEMKIYRGEGKWALRRILEKYIPNQLINRPKMGFGVPIDSWLRGALFDWAKSILNENIIRNDGFFNYEEINKLWREHQSGKYNHEHKLWNILMFQTWLHNSENS
jgi:asparagine synthase (glutamine-hydrolysing)